MMLTVNCPYCDNLILLKNKLAYYPVELEVCDKCKELFSVEYSTKTTFVARARKTKDCFEGE